MSLTNNVVLAVGVQHEELTSFHSEITAQKCCRLLLQMLLVCLPPLLWLLSALCVMCVIPALVKLSGGNSRKGKVQEKKRRVPYQLAFANPEGTFANRARMVNLYGKFRKAEGFIERAFWVGISIGQNPKFT